MTTLEINDLPTLRARFAAQSEDSLFRGQVQHFEDAVGAPSITTSFDRHGCVPPKMLKWTHYAKELFRVLSGPGHVTPKHYPDAILQHYGWRSFYVDVTKSPAVAAWFASHTHTPGKEVIEMTEDANEEFVMLVHNTPKYVPAEKPGHIYVISKTKAQTGDAVFVDLTEIECEDTKPRFHSQQGGLIGPLSKRLAPEAVLEHWIVPAPVLRDFAAEAGLHQTSDLFPSREEDIFLKLLLAVPWEHVGGEPEDPIYGRGLDIPEYDYRPTRWHPFNTAFSRRKWLSRTDHLGKYSLLASALRFGVVEESFYYHVDSPPQKLPRLAKILGENPVVVIETDDIVRASEGASSDEYTKGIVLHRAESSLVHLSELAAKHPGIKLTGARALAPWTYRLDSDGTFVRQPHEHDCPCNNPGRHEQLFRYAQVIECLLGEGAFRGVSTLEYRHKDRATN
jgi:hypothetical protein